MFPVMAKNPAKLSKLPATAGDPVRKAHAKLQQLCSFRLPAGLKRAESSQAELMNRNRVIQV